MCNFFKYVKEDYIIGCPADVKLERQWTKRDLFEYLNMNTNEYLSSVQQQAGALLTFKNNKVTTMVTEWYNIGCNYHLIDDTPSLLENTDDFREHRHDQSIYSWRGAEIKNFLEFDQVYENTKVIRLEENYRSSQNIF